MKDKWVELISVVGLLAGLVFVGLEIRQNTRALQGGTVQAAAELQIEMILRGMEADFNADEQMKLGWFFSALTNLEENRFRQIQLETADAEILEELPESWIEHPHPLPPTSRSTQANW